MPLLQAVIDEIEVEHRARVLACPFVKHILDRRVVGPPSTATPRASPRPSSSLPHVRRRPQPVRLIGNLDLAVLRPENQNPTHVTPRIDSLAHGLFHEHLHVVGPPPKIPSRQEAKRQDILRQTYLHQLLSVCKLHEGNRISWPRKEKLVDEYWKSAIINSETYEVSCPTIQVDMPLSLLR